MMVLPRSRAVFHLAWVARGSAAKKVKSTRSNCSGRMLWMKAHLVADRFQLAERLVVIEQANIDGGKIAVAQRFRRFLFP